MSPPPSCKDHQLEASVSAHLVRFQISNFKIWIFFLLLNGGAWPFSAAAASGTWTNLNGGSWTNSNNWSGGTIADAAGNTADFSTLSLTADATVTLDAPQTIGSLVFGDATPDHNWFLNSGSGGVLTLAVSSGTPVITVNNQVATFGVVLAGTQGFTKAGSGKLTLTNTNMFTGKVSITNGTMQAAVGCLITNGSSGFMVSGPMASNATLNVIGGSIISSGSGGSFFIGQNAGEAGAVNLSAGTLTITNGTEIYAGGNGSANIAAAWNQTGGNVTVSTGNHIYTGMGSGGSTFLNFSGGTFTVVPGNGSVTFTIGGRSLTTMTLSNTAVVTAPTLRYGWGSSLTATMGGTVNLNGGTLAVGGITKPFTCQSNQFNFNGGTLLATAANASFMPNLFNAAIAESGAIINDGGFSIVIAQPLMHGGVAATDGGLTKLGAGILTLTATNAYTGSTTVSNGTLLISGPLASGAVAVGSGAAFGGSGTIAGTVTVQSGGSLTNGTGGNLSTTNLAFSGNASVDVIPSLSAAAFSATSTNGLAANGGANSVTINIRGSAPASGIYHLLSYLGSLQGTGFDAFQLGLTPFGAYCSLTNNAGYIDLVVSSGPPPVLATLTNGIIAVTLDTAFPQPVQYQLVTNGGILYGGDLTAPHNILINGTNQSATVTSFTNYGSYALYTVAVPGAALDIFYRFELSSNVLVRSITAITGAGETNLQTINLGTPIMWVSTNQPGASAAWEQNVNPDLYANYSGDISGETIGALTNLTTGWWYSTWCFVSTTQAVGTAYNNLFDYPFIFQVTNVAGVKCAAIYDRDYTYRLQNIKPGVWFQSKTYIGGDVNTNGVVDWQDGVPWVRDQLPPMLPALGSLYASGGAWQQSSVGYLVDTTHSTVNTAYPLYASQMRQVFYQTEGVPQTMECAGWTYRGHDWMWADWDQMVNPGGGGRAAYDQARAACVKYNGDLSFHVNQDLIATTSVHWDPTVVAKDINGNNLGLYSYIGQTFYDISHFLDLQAGSLTNRINNFLQLFAPPPTVVYCDQMWDHPSAYKGGSGVAEHYAKNIIISTFRNQGTSTTTEGYQPSLFRNAMLQCKYRNNNVSHIDDFVDAGKLMFQFVSGNTAEFSNPYYMMFASQSSENYRSGNIFGSANWMANVMIDDTYLYTMMNAYMRQYPAMEYMEDSAQQKVRWGSNLIARTDKTTLDFTLTQGSLTIADGTDRFIPALDGSQKVYVYSLTGSYNRNWALPLAWAGVTAADRYELTECGRTYIDRLSVSNGLVTLNTPARVPYIIVPAVGAASATGPVNRATGNTAVASSVTGSDVASNAIDGNNTTVWTAGGTTSQWLEVDFSRETEMNRIEIEEKGTNVIAFELQFFNGSNWVDCASGATIGPNLRKVFPNVRSDRVRLLIDAAQNNPQIAEFKVFADANLARTATASASVNSGSGWGDNYVTNSLQWEEDIQASRAMDGAPETYWRASGQTTNAWLEADFNRSSKINRVVLNENGNNVTSLNLQIWNGIAWQTIYTGTTIGGTNEISFAEVQTTKVRMNITGASAPPAISEFQIFDVGGFIAAPAPAPNYDYALGGIATQSSTYSASGAPQVANRAIDGNTDGVWSDNSVSCTAGTELGWWEVDLQSPKTIGQVAVWWRTDCCETRNENVNLVIYDTNNTNAQVALLTLPISGASVPTNNPTVLILPSPVTGQVVKLVHTSATDLSDPNNAQLCLAEVQIYPLPSLAFSYSGGQLMLAWPGWSYTLQQNTNLLNVAGWTDMVGSSNPATIIPPSVGSIFYRLRQ
jgi:autotransporter-associated beta strand protein